MKKEEIIKRNSGKNPAFPSKFTFGDKDEFGAPIIRDRVSFGISKRLFLAGMAMQGLLSAQSIDGVDAEWTARTSFNCADWLLKLEEEEECHI